MKASSCISVRLTAGRRATEAAARAVVLLAFLAGWLELAQAQTQHPASDGKAARKALAARLHRDVRTEFVMVTTMTRMSVIEEHRADIVCETATVTWPRQQHVDFTLPIFRDGTRILAYRETINRIHELHDLRIGVVDGSVTGEILKDKMPDIPLTSFATMPDALRALEAGRVDGIANTGLVLRGLLARADRRQGLVIVPRGEALGYETLACLVPKDDPAWRDFVNGAFRELFRGITEYRGPYMRIYDRWFGRDADIT